MDIIYTFLIYYSIFLLLSCYSCLEYKENKLDGYDLCASKTSKPFKTIHDFFRGHEIELKTGLSSAAIITQIWNSTYYPKMKSECKFRIKSKGGIYIVITKLQFRKDPITNECIDYIEFSQDSSRKIRDRTCEKFGIDDTKTHLFFYDRDKEIYITVFVDQRIEIIEQLQISFVATAHYECNSGSREFQCDVTNRTSCIFDEFVNDGVKNCMPPCRDEIDCSLEPLSVKIVDASNVALSAITSLIFTMIGVGTCLWICWKYKDCVAINQEDNNSNNEPPRQNNEIRPQRSEQTANIEIQRPPSPKEDLPPSYDSLFPER